MDVMIDPFIRVNGLRKIYRKRDDEFLAISDATFDVAPGELVSLVGPSGCGKTTLLKVLAGLQDYNSGEVHIGSPNSPVRSVPGHRHGFPAAAVAQMAPGATECHAASGDLGPAKPGEVANARIIFLQWSGSPGSRKSTRMSFPVECSSGLPLRVLSSTIQSSF